MVRNQQRSRSWIRRGVVLLAVAALCLVQPTGAQADDPETDCAPPPALGSGLEIALIGINDFEGAINSETVALAGTVEQIRARYGDASTLFISAGDDIGFNPSPGVWTPDGVARANGTTLPTYSILNALDLDAAAVGNHDYHYGFPLLAGEFSDSAEYPFLSANTYKSNQRVFASHAMFDVAGVKVAVIAATTRDTPLTNPLVLLWGLKFLNPVAEVNATAAQLNALPDPPDVIVAAYHEGATFPGQEDANHTDESRITYLTSPDVDVIFTGHTHDRYARKAPVPGSTQATRPVVHSGHDHDRVSEVVLSIDSSTHDVLGSTVRTVCRTEVPDADLIAQFPRVAEVAAIVDAATAYQD